MVQVIKRVKPVEIVRVPSKKFLTFNLEKEVYAIDIFYVQEIRASTEKKVLTKIANAPTYIKGIAYLNNNVVPIIDLRIFYNLKQENYNEFIVFIVLNINNKFIGIVVDNVNEIIELTEEQIKIVPELCSIIHQNFIKGIGQVADNLVFILDIERMIFSSELKVSEHLPSA